ncbi:MAG TPA: VWA domain-containing protein [Thermoanaerobaculia bacterium]|nr:VWA domain-containing protein [Thermoanaerobaculia bacterium]
MHRYRSLLVAVACLAAVALGGGAAAAPSAAPSPPPPAAGPPASAGAFAEAVDVELVTIDVWVSDRQGQPVAGLGAGDFQLLQDGQPVAITHFAEVRGAAGTPAAGGAAAAAATSAAGSPAPPSAAPPADEGAGHLVLYFDQLHLHPRDYAPLVEGVQRLLAAEAVPAERVLVLRQDRNLHVEVPFGSTRAELDAGLGRIAASRVLGDNVDVDQVLASLGTAWEESERLAGARTRTEGAEPGGERAQTGGPRAAVGGSNGGGGLGPDACELFVDRIESTVNAWVRERADRTATTLRHLQQTGVILAGLPGVKSLVYLSDALETEPATPLTAAANAVCPGRNLDFTPPEMPRELLALTRHLNTNQVTVYALQASGLRVGESATAGSRTFAAGAAAARVGAAFDSAQRTSERHGMGVLADETGGRLTVNQNDLGGELLRIAGEMGSYYSLGYRPPTAGGTGEHRVEVRLADRSLEARYRRGWREKDAEQRLSELLEGALYLGLAANPLAVRLGAAEPRSSGERRVVPLHAFVPVDRLLFTGPDGAPAAQVRLRVLARNAANPRQESQSRVFRVRRPPGAGGAADLAVELQLDPGTNVIAVALRDEASGLTSLVSTTLEIGH